MQEIVCTLDGVVGLHAPRNVMVELNIVSEEVPLGMVGSNVLRKDYEKNEYAIEKGAEQTSHDCPKNETFHIYKRVTIILRTTYRNMKINNSTI